MVIKKCWFAVSLKFITELFKAVKVKTLRSDSNSAKFQNPHHFFLQFSNPVFSSPTFFLQISSFFSPLFFFFFLHLFFLVIPHFIFPLLCGFYLVAVILFSSKLLCNSLHFCLLLLRLVFYFHPETWTFLHFCVSFSLRVLFLFFFLPRCLFHTS